MSTHRQLAVGQSIFQMLQEPEPERAVERNRARRKDSRLAAQATFPGEDVC